MKYKWYLARGKRGGEIVDGSFLGKELLVLEPPKKKKKHFQWIKKVLMEVISWI